MQVYFRDGSAITMNVQSSGFVWEDIKVDGRTDPENINWSDIKQLRLTPSLINEQEEFVNELLAKLESRSYHVREKAENELADPEFATVYQSLIRKRLEEIKDVEARYRIQRVLDNIDDVTGDLGLQFDQLEMKDGTTKIGSVTNFLLRGSAFNKNFQLFRENVRNVTQVAKITSSPKLDRVKVSTFNSISPAFYDASKQIIASFEKDQYRIATVVGTEVSDLFAHKGLLFRTEMPGHMKLIKYRFKFCPIECGDRCICPYDDATQKRLKGATIINFCMPDQPDVAAGVNRFAVFLERIEHSRDVVVEAYNTHGQMLGMVEATDRLCVFAGFESNQLITSIRIAKNEDLPELDRPVDETYALDCVCLSEPVAVKEITRLRVGRKPHAAQINFVDGQSFLVNKVELTKTSVGFMNPVAGDKSYLPWSKIKSVAMPDLLRKRLKHKSSKRIMAQLKNGAIVQVEKADFNASYDFIGHRFESSDIVGIWNDTARLPEKDDFDLSNPVVVYPSCRILTNGFFQEGNRYRWDKSQSEKVVQQVLLHDEDDVFSHEQEMDPDFTPQTDMVDVAGDEEIPSLWLKPPKVSDLTLPHLRLFDGQYFPLGPDSGFVVKNIDPKKKLIEVMIGDYSKTYPLSRVASISLPK